MRVLTMVRGLGAEFRASPISAAADTLSVVTVVGSAAGATVGIALPDQGGMGFGLGGLFSAMTEAAFPAKLAVVALLSCALGWAAAVVSDMLAKARSDVAGQLGWISTLCAAALLVWISQSFSDMNARGILPQFNLLVVIGLGISLCLMRKKFEMSGRRGHPALAQQRSTTMLVFGGGTLAVTALAELAVLG